MSWTAECCVVTAVSTALMICSWTWSSSWSLHAQIWGGKGGGRRRVGGGGGARPGAGRRAARGGGGGGGGEGRCGGRAERGGDGRAGAEGRQARRTVSITTSISPRRAAPAWTTLPRT